VKLLFTFLLTSFVNPGLCDNSSNNNNKIRVTAAADTRVHPKTTSKFAQFEREKNFIICLTSHPHHNEGRGNQEAGLFMDLMSECTGNTMQEI
jgi:hypothetical protein